VESKLQRQRKVLRSARTKQKAEMPAADVPVISWGADILEGKYRSTEPPKGRRTISTSRRADLFAPSNIEQQRTSIALDVSVPGSWAGMKLLY
jgi:hypothetical protein